MSSFCRGVTSGQSGPVPPPRPRAASGAPCRAGASHARSCKSALEAVRAECGKTCSPSRCSMSGPMLAANTPTKSVLATSVGISRSSLTCTASRIPSLKKLSDGHGRMFDLASMMNGHELRLPQILDGDTHIDRRMTAPGQEHQPIIKQFPVYERIQLDRQPVDGDVHDAITKAFLKVQWPRNSIERQHDTGGGSRYRGFARRASKMAPWDAGC